MEILKINGKFIKSFSWIQEEIKKGKTPEDFVFIDASLFIDGNNLSGICNYDDDKALVFGKMLGDGKYKLFSWSKKGDLNSITLDDGDKQFNSILNNFAFNGKDVSEQTIAYGNLEFGLQEISKSDCMQLINEVDKLCAICPIEFLATRKPLFYDNKFCLDLFTEQSELLKTGEVLLYKFEEGLDITNMFYDCNNMFNEYVESLGIEDGEYFDITPEMREKIVEIVNEILTKENEVAKMTPPLFNLVKEHLKEGLEYILDNDITIDSYVCLNQINNEYINMVNKYDPIETYAESLLQQCECNKEETKKTLDFIYELSTKIDSDEEVKELLSEIYGVDSQKDEMFMNYFLYNSLKEYYSVDDSELYSDLCLLYNIYFDSEFMDIQEELQNGNS